MRGVNASIRRSLRCWKETQTRTVVSPCCFPQSPAPIRSIVRCVPPARRHALRVRRGCRGPCRSRGWRSLRARDVGFAASGRVLTAPCYCEGFVGNHSRAHIALPRAATDKATLTPYDGVVAARRPINQSPPRPTATREFAQRRCHQRAILPARCCGRLACLAQSVEQPGQPTSNNRRSQSGSSAVRLNLRTAHSSATFSNDATTTSPTLSAPNGTPSTFVTIRGPSSTRTIATLYGGTGSGA